MRRVGSLTALIVFVGVLAAPVPGAAQPAHAHVVGTRVLSPTHTVVDVYSPSMNRVIPNDVLRPAHGGSLPTLYLLNGVVGNEDGVGWINNSQAASFFADKNVTVVLPIGGRYSFYTDWNSPDLVLGVNKWQTYLTQELPAVMDREFGGTGLNAVAGLSMSAGPALDLAIQAPGLYRATAAFSGCPAPTAPLATLGITAVNAVGLANPFNMWGLPGSPEWHAHDPSLNAERLHGTAVYVSASRGAVGAVDRIPAGAFPPIDGMVVEAFTYRCTELFVDALRAANVPATVSMRATGAHTWGLFEDQLREAWGTTIAPALRTR